MKFSTLFISVLLMNTISHADMIAIKCSAPGDKSKISFTSESTEPAAEDLQFVSLKYNERKIKISNIQTLNSKNYNRLTGYIVNQVRNQSGNDIPHLQIEFKNLEACGDAEYTGTPPQAVVRNIGGFAGLLTVETFQNCTCDID